jgi:hypothetical protein
MTQLPQGLPPTGIRTRQNEPDYLRILYAKKRSHDVANRWANLNVAGTVGLAALAPIATFLLPATANWLGVVAAIWLVAGRAFLARRERTWSTRGAAYQELFETRVFNLDWNRALVGDEPRLDELIEDAQHVRKPDSQLDWFYDDGKTPRPVDVLLAQLESTLWSRRDHDKYARAIRGFAAVVFVVGLSSAIARSLTLADYLVRLALPLLPALQDAWTLAEEHHRHAAHKARLEDDIVRVLRMRAEGLDISDTACRDIQDSLYQARITGPTVPSWYHLLRKKSTSSIVHQTIDARRGTFLDT